MHEEEEAEVGNESDDEVDDDIDAFYLGKWINNSNLPPKTVQIYGLVMTMRRCTSVDSFMHGIQTLSLLLDWVIIQLQQFCVVVGEMLNAMEIPPQLIIVSEVRELQDIADTVLKNNDKELWRLTCPHSQSFCWSKSSQSW